jgi:hypothetical protein
MALRLQGSALRTRTDIRYLVWEQHTMWPVLEPRRNLYERYTRMKLMHNLAVEPPQTLHAAMPEQVHSDLNRI